MDKVVLDFKSVCAGLCILLTVKAFSSQRALRFFVITVAVEPAVGSLGTEVNDIECIVGTGRIIFKRRFIICLNDKCIRPEFFDDFRTGR